MKKIFNKKNMMIMLLFIFVFSLFAIAAGLEFRRGVLEEKNRIQSEIQILSANVNNAISQSILRADGIVSFVKSYPELDQEMFSNYASTIGKQAHEIVSHYVAIRDTTISFAYPLEGNESGIGVDLALVEDQKDQIFMVRDENVSLLVGPIDLVQGGSRLINRMPIYIGDIYWGQLSVLIKYELLIDLAGIYDLSTDHYVQIEQIGIREESNIIYSNNADFTKEAVEATIELPNGKWVIKLEPKDGFSGVTAIFVTLLIIGFIISIIVSLIFRYILNTNENLSDLLNIRTQSIQHMNKDLAHSMNRLKTTQDQLINKEKHAALGELVASVAHEINTPLGVCVTANSFIENLSTELGNELELKTLKKSQLKNSLLKVIDSSMVIAKNLERASKLIYSFKMLASEQHFEELKHFYVKEYVEYVVHALSPKFNKTSHSIQTDINEYLDFVTYPGALSQVLTNLLMNSLDHGFEDIENGEVLIKAEIVNDNLVIDYFDNGKGINKDIQHMIFEPFFTTRRDVGNSGLGMNIVYKIITEQLNGNIKLIDDVETGVHFNIILNA